ncbi:MAG: DUF6514 family protein [Clostridia bacterium]|nr:DUF6514 family protein [Clostridia bacterium]
MNAFFGSIFIEKEKLREAGVEYPIKLEYYKIINEDEFINRENAKYGIKIVKTEYKKNNTKIEDKTIRYLSNNEQRVEDILSLFKRNEVTPVCAKDIIYDFSKEVYLI